MNGRSRIRALGFGILLIISGPIEGWAQETYPEAGRGAGVQFLKLGHGPAGAALADGLTAWSGSADAIHWNPAAAAGNPEGTGAWQFLSLAGASLYGDDRFTSLMWGQSWSGGGVALAVAYNGITGIEVRGDLPTAEPLAYTSAHDLAAGLSAGIKFSNGLAAGITAKGIYEKLYQADAFGLALDAGVQLPLPVAGGLLQGGVAVRNLGRMGRLEEERLRLPWSLAGGVALREPLELGRVTLRAGADLWKPYEDWARVRVGAEARRDPLALRLGTRQGKGWGVITAGLGLRFGVWALDYSYEYDPDSNRHFLGSVQRLGLTVDVQALRASGGRAPER